MTGEDMWQLIMFSTVHSTSIVGFGASPRKFFGVPIFSENGKTLIRFTFGSSPKSEAHDISVFRVTKRSDAKGCIVGTVSCYWCLLLSKLNLHCKCIVILF